MDAVTLLKQDHQNVEGLFRRYESLGGDQVEQRRQVVNDFIRELSIHASIEEQILYPEVKDVLAGGKSMADEALQEHQEAKEALADLDDMDANDPEFDMKVRTLIAEVRHHVEEEEGEMLPQLALAVPASTLIELGEKMENAKAMAPTRPHPHAPSTPPGNVVAGMAAGAVDRVRDMVSGRGQAEEPTPKKRTTRRKSTSQRKTTSGGRTRKAKTSSPKRKSSTSAKRKTTSASKRRSTTARRSRPSSSGTRKKTTSRSKPSTTKRSTTKRSTASKRRTSTQRKGRRGSEPVFHVISDPKGGWRAEREGSNRAVARGDDKQPVVTRARQLARSKGGRLVIHKANGRIQEQRSYAA